MSLGTPATVEEILVHVEGKRHVAYKVDIAPNVAGAVTSSRLVIGSGDVRSLIGWSIRETTGNAVANFRLHDGTSAANEVLANANLNQNESIRDIWYPWGIVVNTGSMWLEVITGSIEGVLYYNRAW